MTQHIARSIKSMGLWAAGVLAAVLIDTGHGQAWAAGGSERHDLVTFSAPVGWRKDTGNAYVQFSRIDGTDWAQIGVYRSVPGTGDVRVDFDKEWNELVVGPFGATRSPEKTEPQRAEGWVVMSGAARWQRQGAEVTTLLTVYAGHGVSVSILCNATAHAYLQDCQRFIGSATLQAPSGARSDTATAVAGEPIRQGAPSTPSGRDDSLPDGRYGCFVLTTAPGYNGTIQTQWKPSLLPSFTLSDGRYQAGRVGGDVRRAGEILAFVGGDFDGFQASVLPNASTPAFVFRHGSHNVARPGPATWGDTQCSRSNQ